MLMNVTISFKIDEFQSFRLNGTSVRNSNNLTFEQFLFCSDSVSKRVSRFDVAFEVRISDDLLV